MDQGTFTLMMIKLKLKHLKFSERISKNFTKFNSNVQKNGYTDILQEMKKITHLAYSKCHKQFCKYPHKNSWLKYFNLTKNEIP